MYKQVLQDFKTKDLRRLIEDKTSCIKLHQTKYNLILYPYHFNNVKQSVKDLLNVVITKYDKTLGGILMGYKNIKILEPDGGIQADSCFIHIDIEGDFYVFLPKVGKKLSGIVNKISSDHVGCLVHKVFNVSIPNVDADENWLGKQVELGQEVLLRVTFLNLEGPLPYIRTKLLSLGAKPDPASVNYLNIPEHNFESSIKHNKHVKYNKHLIDDEEETDFNHPETNEIRTKQKKKSKKHSVEHTEETSSSKLQEEEVFSSTKKKKSKKHSVENFEDTPAESIKEEKLRKSLEYLTQLQSTKTQEDSISKKKKKSKNDLADSSGGVTPKNKKSPKVSENLDEYPSIADLISNQKKSLNFYEDFDENSDSLRLPTAPTPKMKKTKYSEENINIAKVQKKNSKKNTSITFENDSATNDLSSKMKKSKKSFNLDSQNELNHSENYEEYSSVTPKKMKSKQSLEKPEETFGNTKDTSDNFVEDRINAIVTSKNIKLKKSIEKKGKSLENNPEKSPVTPKKRKSKKSLENSDKNLDLPKIPSTLNLSTLENSKDNTSSISKKKTSKKSLESIEDTLDISEIQTSLISNAFENFKDKSTVEEKSKKKKSKKSLENQEDSSTATKTNENSLLRTPKKKKSIDNFEEGRNISAQTPSKQNKLVTPKKKLKNVSFDSLKIELENGPQTPEEKKLTNDLSLYFSKIGESTPYATKKTDQHFDASPNISNIHSFDSSPKKRKRGEDELDTSTNKKKKHKNNKQEEKASTEKSELDLIKESLLAQKLADLKAESSESTKKPYLSVMPVKNLQTGTIKKRRHTTQERLVSVNSNFSLNLHDSDLEEILSSTKPEENATEHNKDVKKMKKKRRLSMVELPVESVDSQVDNRHKKKKKSVNYLDD